MSVSLSGVPPNPPTLPAQHPTTLPYLTKQQLPQACTHVASTKARTRTNCVGCVSICSHPLPRAFTAPLHVVIRCLLVCLLFHTVPTPLRCGQTGHALFCVSCPAVAVSVRRYGTSVTRAPLCNRFRCVVPPIFRALKTSDGHPFCSDSIACWTTDGAVDEVSLERPYRKTGSCAVSRVMKLQEVSCTVLCLRIMYPLALGTGMGMDFATHLICLSTSFSPLSR